MSLEQKINDDYVHAMKHGEQSRKDTLRLLRAAVKNAAIEAGHPLADGEVLAVLAKQAKQRRDSIEQFGKGGRPDLVVLEEAELAVIESYLPQQLTEAEIEAVVRRHVAALGVTGPAEMGKVMAPVMAEVAGQADGKVVSGVVRRVLGNS